MKHSCAPALLEHEAARVPLSRRRWLQSLAAGFGSVVLADLLAQAQAAPLPHHRPRAKRVIFLFMAGGPSQVDTFDYKPVLQKMHGKSYTRPIPGLPEKFARYAGVLFGSPFRFAQHGQSGQWFSELFPHLAQHADRLCFLKGMHTQGFDHGQAGLFFHTGASNFVRPSLGAWVSYGLGSENRNLPSFVHLGPSPDYGGSRLHSNAFLPARHQGLAIGSASLPVQQWQVRNLHNARVPRSWQARQLSLLRGMNHRHRQQAGGAVEKIDGLLQSFETAFRMQTAASHVFDLAGETQQMLDLYGIGQPETDDFGRQCLLARRLSEAGVRFVMLTHSLRKRYASVREWDQHQHLEQNHRRNARQVDRPIAALLSDLHARGLLEETLVVWAGEFGRSPMIERKPGQPDRITPSSGRDHNPLGFTIWMAGGGVRPGFSYGGTDEIGFRAVEGRVHTHDLHATILHLLGLDHQRLTYHYAGRDFRLTDVSGRVVHEILA